MPWRLRRVGPLSYDWSVNMRWPDADVAAMRDGEAFHQGAAVCRRGHIQTQHLDPRKGLAEIPENCTKCGARVLAACPNCELRIRGKRFMRMVISATPAPRPSFCDGCGAAFPWASREERIYELENLLDEEAVDEADRVVIQDALERLRTKELSEKEERQAWETIKQRGGAAITSAPVKRVLEGLLSAAVRASLGL